MCVFLCVCVFNNIHGLVVREKVLITYRHWKDVQGQLKTYMWEEVKRRFMYPEGID